MRYIWKSKYYIFFTTFILLGCSSKDNSSDQQEIFKLSNEFKEQIDFVHPKLQLLEKEIHLSGIVETNPEKVSPFSNIVDGIITNTYFSLGDYVKKGQVLADLQSTVLTEWRSKERILNSNLELAKSQLESILQMHKDGISSLQSVREAENEIINIEAELDEIQSNLKLYNAGNNSNVFHIKSPSNGYVIKKNIYDGMQIEAYGEPLFTIADLDEIWIQINVYPSDIKNITVNLPVTINSLAYPDSIFEGKIDAISPILDEETRVMKARVSIPNPNLLLKPGMYVDVNVLNKSENEVLALPISTLIFDDNNNYLLLYKNESDISIKKVEIIGQTNGIYFLEKDELQPTDKVISKGQLLIYEALKN